MRRNLLITICILIISSACLFAESSLGTIQFDYNIYKQSVGTVSSYYFVDTNGARIDQIAIDMNSEGTMLSPFSTPQLYFVQENNLKSSDTPRRVKLYFTQFTPTDGKNAGFKGNYVVALWRLNDPMNFGSGLKTKRDKAIDLKNNPKYFDWGLDNSNSQNGDPIACYYALTFTFSGNVEVKDNNWTTVNYLDTYQPGEYSATITVEIQGN
jgi:hypothetical protein